MGDLKKHAMFFAGVAISVLIINNVSFLQGIVYKNYTSSGS